MALTRTTLATAAALAATVAVALHNGFTTPAMGYSTWNDCSSFRDNGPNGWCWNTEDHIKNVTRYLIDSGLAKLGYVHVNVDEGWLKGRFPNGTIYEDTDKFPSGMKGLGDWVHAQETSPGSGQFMRYGLYSCRGTCQCGTGTYSAPGGNGYEAQDTAWMIAAGADYLKIDSCCGSQDHATAFSDYTKWRDAMNASGKQVWFSLCGWEEWYAPPDPTLNYAGGPSLGNSYRIAGDGSGWGPLSSCMNTIAAIGNWSQPGGWADPDLLIGPQVYVGGQTDEQARAQFSMWSLFPANLLISQNVLAWSDYALETYSNTEAIAINQDPLMSNAMRIVGSDLPFPCDDDPSRLATVVATAKCDGTDVTQQWDYDATTGAIYSRAFAGQQGVLDNDNCQTTDGSIVAIKPFSHGSGTCNGLNQKWTWNASAAAGNGYGTIINGYSNTCLDVFAWAGPQVDIWTCNGGVNQNFTHDAKTGLISTLASSQYPTVCLQAVKTSPQQCTNVWGRTLSGGAYALGMVNNAASSRDVTCDSSCFAALNIPPSVTALTVRDVWAHQDIAHLTPPFTFTTPVNGSGFAGLFKLTPA